MEPKSVSKSVRKTGITAVAAAIMAAIYIRSGLLWSVRTLRRLKDAPHLRAASIVSASFLLLFAGLPGLVGADDDDTKKIEVKTVAGAISSTTLHTYFISPPTDGHRVRSFFNTGTFTGEGMNGGWKFPFHTVRDESTLKYVAQGVGSCTCVDGHTGALIWRGEWRGVSGGPFEGTWEILKGTGDLEGAGGGGTIKSPGAGGPTTFDFIGTIKVKRGSGIP